MGHWLGRHCPYWWERKIWYAGVLVKWEVRSPWRPSPTIGLSGLDRGKPAAQLLRWHLDEATERTNLAAIPWGLGVEIFSPLSSPLRSLRLVRFVQMLVTSSRR